MGRAGGIENRVIALSLIDAHPRNYNKHSAAQLADLAASLDQFGQVRSIVVQRKGKRFTAVAGHGIAEAARSLGWKEIRADVIPSGWSQTRVLAYLAADNELARRGDPDQDQLAAIVQEVLNAEGETLARLAAGEQSALDALLVRANPKEETADAGALVDKAAELQKKWKVARGDVWQIGKHRLMCGDSNDPYTADRLEIEPAETLVFSDPPYGVSVVANNGKIGAGNLAQNQTYAPIVGDETTQTARDFYNLYCGMGVEDFILWGGNYFTDFLPPRACWLIWDKREGMNSNNFADCEIAYTSFPAPSRIYRHLWNGMIRKGKEGSKYHPTQKPVALHADILRAFGKNKTVFDGFAGSGTTFLACEQVGLSCVGAEVSPEYCAVTLERLSLLGLTPQRIENVGEIGHRNDGKPKRKK